MDSFFSAGRKNFRANTIIANTTTEIQWLEFQEDYYIWSYSHYSGKFSQGYQSKFGLSKKEYGIKSISLPGNEVSYLKHVSQEQ